MVFKIASTADAVGNILVGENHLILRTHATNHSTTGPTVVFSNQEREWKQADLTLFNLVN